MATLLDAPVTTTQAHASPGDKVLDLIPGDGYWTRIFSRIVGPEGKVYALVPAEGSTGSVEASL